MDVMRNHWRGLAGKSCDLTDIYLRSLVCRVERDGVTYWEALVLRQVRKK